MRVEWTDQAKKGRKQIADYIRDRFWTQTQEGFYPRGQQGRKNAYAITKRWFR